MYYLSFASMYYDIGLCINFVILSDIYTSEFRYAFLQSVFTHCELVRASENATTCLQGPELGSRVQKRTLKTYV